MASLYDDLPVGDGEFRLLRLEPDSETSNPLKICLHTQTIASSMNSYDAISYHWGDSRDRCNITVNGTETLVTRNLYTALKYMRHASMERCLWIDGLCIDQENMRERSHQVIEMRHIYSYARRVRIWLGEATADAEAAMKLVSRTQTGPDANERSIVDLVRSEPIGVTALTKLLERPYWQRMWVFQEIVLAKYAVVHCGRFEVDWSHFLTMDIALGDQRLWADVPMKEHWVHDIRRAFFGIAHFCIHRRQAKNLHNVLYPTRSLKATDPRDKLYALFGVCEISEALEFVPDYRRSVRLVYTDFTRNLMQMEGDISSILTAGLWDSNNGPDILLPTWVPDYRGSHGLNIRYLAASYLEHFNASKGSSAGRDFKLDEDGEPTRLTVRGILFDTIKETTLLDDWVETQQLIHNFINPNTRHQYQSSQPEISSLDSAFRTMIFDDPTLSPEHNPDRLARLALGFAYEVLVATDGQNLDIFTAVNDFLASHQAPTESRPQSLLGRYFAGLTQKKLSERFSGLMKEDPEELYWYREEYLTRSRETSQGPIPSIFTTAKGRIGKGLSTVGPGDRAAVIIGCRIPVILRPCGQYFQLVGPCYISGAMDGEIIQQLETEYGAVEQTTTLL